MTQQRDSATPDHSKVQKLVIWEMVRQMRKQIKESPGLSHAPFSDEGWGVIEAALSEIRPTITSDQFKGTDILGAVARGWCHPKNENKVMDPDLAIAIASEINDLLVLGPPGPDTPVYQPAPEQRCVELRKDDK